MSQAMELLNSLTDEELTAYANRKNAAISEEHIVIGADRIVSVPAALRRLAVQYDHNVETVTFDCPRYWDGLDMSKMQIYINYLLPDRRLGSYLAQNVTVDGSDNNVMHFTWTISNHVSKSPGSISFLICIKKTDAEGNDVNHWNSELNQECFISKGMETVETIISEHPDIITQLLTRMDAVEAVQDIAVNAAAEATAKAEEASGYSDAAAALLEETKGYTKTAQDVAADMVNIGGRIDRNDKRLTILEQGLSDYVPSVTDTGVAYVKDIPANALPYTRINEIGGMSYKCENLIPYPYANIPKTMGGITFTDNGDGTITANGTAIEFMAIVLWKQDSFNVTSGALSGCPKSISGISLGIYDYDIGEYIVRDYGNGAVFEITATNIAVAILISGGTVLNNAIFAPMLNRGETALPYQPYFTGLRDSKVTAVESVGANLIPFPYYTKGTHTEHGITSTINADGSVTLSGTNTSGTVLNAVLLISNQAPITLGAGTYTLSNTIVGTGAYIIGAVRYKESTTSSYITAGTTFTVATTATLWLVAQVDTGCTSNITIYPILNRGDTALPYTPYVKRTFEIPEAVQNIDGHGQGVNEQYYNKIVLNPAEGVKKFVKNVGCVDLGTLNWIFSHGNCFSAMLSSMTLYTRSPLEIPTILCPDYKTITPAQWYNSSTIGISQSANGYGSRCSVLICDTKYTDAASLKAAMSGVMLLYELATPTETDISEYFTDDNLIGVEAGGTITAANEYEHDVPTSLTTWTKKTV